MTTKTIKTILFASLIAAMILPFSMVDVSAAPNENASNNAQKTKLQKLTAYEEGILDNTPSLQGLSDEERDEFVSKLRLQISSFTGYEKQVFKELNELAEIQRDLDNAKAQKRSDSVVKQLNSDLHAKKFSLEDIGVTTQERWDASPEYWANKAINAKKSIEQGDTKKVRGYDSQSDLYAVHQTDLALLRGAIMSFPCWGAAVCPLVQTGWNAGESNVQLWWVPTDGNIGYESSVCLASDTHHNEVTFDMQTKRDLKSILQTWIYVYDNTVSVTLDGDEGECESNYYQRSVSAGSSAGLTTGISNISLN